VPWAEITVVQESAPIADEDIHVGAAFPEVDTLSLSDLGARTMFRSAQPTPSHIS
jgi:hypothetical protein